MTDNANIVSNYGWDSGIRPAASTCEGRTGKSRLRQAARSLAIGNRDRRGEPKADE